MGFVGCGSTVESKGHGGLKKYYGRPAEEFFDLSKDPLEQKNLAFERSHQPEIQRFRQELDRWAKKQGDDLQPHREPYLLSDPIPEVKNPPRKNPPRKKAPKKKTPKKDTE